MYCLVGRKNKNKNTENTQETRTLPGTETKLKSIENFKRMNPELL